MECVEAFLRQTVENLAASQFRTGHRYIKGRIELDDELLRDSAPTPDEGLAAQQRLEQIQRLLPPRTRQVYFMHKFGGFGYAEIAERLGCSISLIEKLLAGAVTKIAHERSRGRLRDE